MDFTSRGTHFGKVLVIGGLGFLGSHIVDALSSCDALVSILDYRCGQESEKDPKIEYHSADITSLNSILSIFENGQFDVVIHTVSPLVLVSKNDQFQKVNVEGTKNVVEACQRTGVKALVYTSTAVVVQNNWTMPIVNAVETWKVFTGEEQEDDYARSKAEAEICVLAANKRHTFHTCALRPSGIFGERDATIMPVIIQTYENGQHHFQIGDNKNLRDFIYVGDLAACHIAAADRLLSAHNSPDSIPDDMKVDGEAFFVTGDPIPFWDFAHAAYRALGDSGEGLTIQINTNAALVLARILEAIFGFFGKESLLTVKNVYGACQVSYFDNTKAKERLGFRTAMPIEEAIEKTIKWFLKNKSSRTHDDDIV